MQHYSKVSGSNEDVRDKGLKEATESRVPLG